MGIGPIRLRGLRPLNSAGMAARKNSSSAYRALPDDPLDKLLQASDEHFPPRLTA